MFQSEPLPVPVTLVEGACVLPAGLAMKGWRLLKESAFWSAPHLLPYWRRYAWYKRLTLQRAPQPLSKAILIHHPWANNYIHWFSDCLQRLFAVEDYSAYPVLLPEEYQRFAEDSLQALGVQVVVKLSMQFYYPIDQLILPHMPTFDSLANAYDKVEDMRRRFWEIWGQPPKNKRIYLSRHKATRRKVINETELLPILEKHGFDFLTTEGMSLGEQVAIFSSTGVLLSLHGAGLMNLLWMRPGGTIIEILSEAHIRRTPPMATYATYAHVFGHRHFYYFAPTAPHSLNDIFDRADVVVEPEKLDAFLSRILS